ncbi:MAG: hypothetical protein AAFP69_09735, partial [Planctomycetota bacterium]
MLRLPIDEILPEIVSGLHTSGIGVLRAPPGAGKTTGVPLALLRHADDVEAAGDRDSSNKIRNPIRRAHCRDTSRLQHDHSSQNRESGFVG